MIKLKNILSEASLKGVEGVPSNKKLSQLSDNDKLKIVQSTGNLISFKVPDWSKGKRNFWTVISNGKIVQKKNLDGITIFILPGKGPEKVSPSYSSVKDLLNGVDWDTMELRRESVNEKNDDDFADFISSRKSYSRPTNWKVIQKDGKYSFESDGFSRVRLMYNGKQIAVGVNDWSTGGYEIEHSSWKNKEKPFQFAKDVIKYFKSNKLTTESVNEAKPAVVGNVNAFGPSKVLGKGGKVLGFVPDTPNAIATLIQDYPNVQAIEFKSPFFFDFNSYKSIKKGDKAWKELMSRGVDKATKVALKKDFQLKESVNEATMSPVRKVVNAILKKHGVVPMKTTSTSVRGFHNIQRGGYRYEGNYFLGFYGVSQDIIDKVGAEMKKAGVKNVDVRKGIISADFTINGLKESVNEAKVKTPDFIVTSIPADAIPSTNISKADVGLGLAMFNALGRGWTLNNKDYKLDYHNGKVALVLTKQGKLAVRVKSGHDPKYVQKIEKFANDYLSKYAKDIKK